MKFWEKTIFVYIFLLGVAFAFIVPPLQKPDEHGHFKRAYYLSHGYLYIFNDGKRLPLDAQLDSLINDVRLNSLPNHPERKLPLPNFRGSPFAGTNSFQPVYQTEKLMFIWGPLAYIPQATGIALARLIGLNAYLTFYAGRAAIFLFSFVFLLWIYRRTGKPFRYLLLFVFTLPMSIHQLTAYSYDAVQILLASLVFSLFVEMMKSKHIPYRKLAVFGLAMVGFMMTKLSYEPMFFLIFLLPWKSIAKTKWGYVKIMSVWIIAVTGLYLLLTAPTYLSSMSYKLHPSGVNPGQQLQFILQHPANYLQTLVTSSWNLKKFHLQGMIGIFGWLDYSLDWWMYLIYIAAAVYIVYKTKISKAERISFSRVLFLLALIFVNYSFIMTVFYLNWKTVGSPVIDGTQGRYFIAFLPVILYSLSQLKYHGRKRS